MVEASEENYRSIREHPFRGIVRADVPTGRILSLVRAFDRGALPAGSQQLSDHAGKYEAYFVPLARPPGEVLLKHFSHRRLSRIVWPFVGVSKAMHSWRIAQHLRRAPRLCSAPIAAIERRAGPLVLDSFFIGEWIQPGTAFIETAVECLIGGERTQAEVLQALADFLAELHDRRVFHSGLHAGNILEEAGEARRLLMIDLDAASIRPSMSNRDRMRMLFDAFEYFMMICKPDDFAELVRCYARSAHIPTGSLDPHMPALIARLERKRAETETQCAGYREEKAVSLLVRPGGLRAERGMRGEYVESWEALTARLKTRGLLCAARHHAERIREAAPEDWLLRLEEEAAREEAEAEKALAKLHPTIKAFLDAGVRPMLLGALPLLQHYGHPLGLAALAPFELLCSPEDLQKALDLLKGAPDLPIRISDKLPLPSPPTPTLTPDLLLSHSAPFDFCGLSILTAAPELALLHYAARCNDRGPDAPRNALLDLTVFLHSCAGDIDADKAARLAMECSAQALLWQAVRRAKLVNRESYPVVEAVLDRLAAAR